MARSLENRIALITGASRGIGAAVAERFAREGAQLILAARGEQGLAETDDRVRQAGGKATLVPIDLTDGQKIEEMARQVATRFGKLDILVSNAAILGELSPLSHQSEALWNKAMAVNFNANWHLIRCFDTLLKASDAPRALFVTSGVTEGVFPYWGAYAVSKSALEAMVKIYAAENAKTPLRANIIDPGVVRTKLRAQAFPTEDPSALAAPELITDIFVKLAGPSVKDTGKKFHVR